MLIFLLSSIRGYAFHPKPRANITHCQLLIVKCRSCAALLHYRHVAVMKHMQLRVWALKTWRTLTRLRRAETETIRASWVQGRNSEAEVSRGIKGSRQRQGQGRKKSASRHASGDTSGWYILCVIINTSIMSPHNHLYFKVGNFKCISLSLYGIFF